MKILFHCWNINTDSTLSSVPVKLDKEQQRNNNEK